MSTDKSYFDKLIAINVKSKVEKKGNLDYLSWANAWAYLKLEHSDAQRNVYESPETGLNWYTDGVTGYVKVGVTIEGVEHIDYLPIMDHNNRSLTKDKITSFAVNKTIQRSTVKAIAMHGLGLSLWIGEDIVQTIKPSAPVSKNPVPSKAMSTHIVLNIGDDNWDKVLKYISVNKDLGLPKIVKNLEAKYKIVASVKKELSKSIK